MAMRKFSIRYGNWNVMTAEVPAEKIEGAAGIDIVRAAVGHAFMDKLKGRWEDGDDIRVVLDKDNPGVWTGRREHPSSKKKDDTFYVMEV